MLSQLTALGGWSFVGAAAIVFAVVAAAVHGLFQFLERPPRGDSLDVENRTGLPDMTNGREASQLDTSAHR